MELRKEYQDIVDAARRCFDFNLVFDGHHVLQVVVKRCQALADNQPDARPVKNLTDAELDALGIDWTSWPEAARAFGRRCIAAHIAKQREPATVKFRAARRKSDGYVQMVECDVVNDLWEWLDADGKAQEFEVRI